MSNFTLYHTETGIQFKLGKKLGSGAEGVVYVIKEGTSPALKSSFVAKILNESHQTLENQNKILYLIKNPPISGNQFGFILPQHLVIQNGRFVGFLMPKVEGVQLEQFCTYKLPKLLQNSAYRAFSFENPLISIPKRIRLCYNIATALANLHQAGNYVLIDMKPANILVDTQGNINFIDLNNIVLLKADLPKAKVLCTPEHAPPEHAHSSIEDYGNAWDYYSAAIVFYRVLTGIHPFAGTTSDKYAHLTDLTQHLAEGLFPHHKNFSSFYSVLPPPHKNFERLSEEIQDLFFRCFVDGHLNKHLRPSTTEWRRALAPVPIPSLVFSFRPNTTDLIKESYALPAPLPPAESPLLQQLNQLNQDMNELKKQINISDNLQYNLLSKENTFPLRQQYFEAVSELDSQVIERISNLEKMRPSTHYQSVLEKIEQLAQAITTRIEKENEKKFNALTQKQNTVHDAIKIFDLEIQTNKQTQLDLDNKYQNSLKIIEQTEQNIIQLEKEKQNISNLLKSNTNAGVELRPKAEYYLMLAQLQEKISQQKKIIEQETVFSPTKSLSELKQALKKLQTQRNELQAQVRDITKEIEQLNAEINQEKATEFAKIKQEYSVELDNAYAQDQAALAQFQTYLQQVILEVQNIYNTTKVIFNTYIRQAIAAQTNQLTELQLTQITALYQLQSQYRYLEYVFNHVDNTEKRYIPQILYWLNR